MATRISALILTFVALCIPFSVPAFSQNKSDVEQLKADVGALKHEIETLKNVQRAIIMELRSMMAQMPSVGPPPEMAPQAVNVTLRIDDAPRIGSKAAKVAIVEFSDFECPYCGRHYETTLPRLQQDYVRTGKVVYIIHDFPLTNLHPHALKAAEAGRCAGDQGRFWDMHAMLFANQSHLESSDLIEYARGLNLDVAKFEQCLTANTHEQDVEQAVEYGRKFHVSATPTFFIGRIDSDLKEVKATARIDGAYPYSIFKTVIDSLLQEAN